MPLSEEEQRILSQIERQLNESDPKAADRISKNSLPRYLARNCTWATLGFLAGLALILAAFATSWILGAAGFIVMVVAAIALIQNLRKMGRHGWDQLSRSVRERTEQRGLGGDNNPFRRRFDR